MKLIDNIVERKFKHQCRVNTLRNEIESLQDIIKNELYKEFIDKVQYCDEITTLREENKKLRKIIKLLKEMLKEGK